MAPVPGAPATFTPVVDRLAGSNSTFGPLQGIAWDAMTAHLYVTDWLNGTVRSVYPFEAFKVATVAGTPPPFGYKDAAATNARFWNIADVTGDGERFYMADGGNRVVREFDASTGTVSTVAGAAGVAGPDDGPLQSARFKGPTGIFLDGQVLYVSDQGGNTIRAVDLSQGSVSTIAGQYGVAGDMDGNGAAALLNGPYYLAGDHAGHLYFTSGSPTIREFTISTKTVKTLAGNAMMSGLMDAVGIQALFEGPSGLTIDNGMLYVCDGTAIRSMTLDLFNVVTIAGSVTPGLKDGKGMAATITATGACGADGRGHVYFSDSGLVRRLDTSSKQVTTVMGKPFIETERPGPIGTATTNLLAGLAFTSSGDIALTDPLEGALMLLRIP